MRLVGFGYTPQHSEQLTISLAPLFRARSESLAACGTILPNARSIFRWEGKIEDASEVIVILKTTHPTSAKDRLAEIHPYTTPEILVFAVEDATAAYLAWVAASCTTNAQPASA